MFVRAAREVLAGVVAAFAGVALLAATLVLMPVFGLMVLLGRIWPGGSTLVSRAGLALVVRLTRRLRARQAAMAGLGLIAGIALPSCGPSCADLERAVAITCVAPDSAACQAARSALEQAYPNGCPAEPTPPVTQPTPTPAPTVVPTLPPTPPPAVDCVLAGEPSTPVPGHRSTLGAAVNAAVLALKPECQVGGTCLLGDETQQQWQARVEAELRDRGLCAGQHSPTTDEIAVARQATDPWEGYDTFGGDDTEGPVPPGGARRTVRWAPPDGSLQTGGYKGAWYPPASACGPPRWESYADPAVEGSCGFVWGLNVGRTWVDATLKVRKCCGFCASLGMGEQPGGGIRCECPLRAEGSAERLACEAEVGAAWEVRGGTLVHHPSNPALATCEEPGCQVRVCTHSGVCSEWVP